jgi:oxaloacetate decarboxylase gamma subunit
MTITEMLGQSAILTVLGIGVVFSFLIIMIGAMMLLHAVLHALKLDVNKETAQGASAAKQSAAPAAAPDMNGIVAAIATALHDKQ